MVSELGLFPGLTEGRGEGDIGPLRRRPSLAEEIAERIRELVYAGHLTSGTALSDSRLAKELGVGRGSIREAFKMLIGEGFLEHNGRDVRIARLTREDVLDIFEIRLAVECRAARIVAAKRNAEDIKELETIVREFKAAVRADQVVQAVDLDLRFHLTLCRLSGSERILQVFTREVVKMFALEGIDVDIYRPLSAWSDELPHVLDALRNGDADAASASLERHIIDTEVAALEVRASRH